MRPDEHKKKKSAQYRKNHGGEAKESKSNEKAAKFHKSEKGVSKGTTGSVNAKSEGKDLQAQPKPAPTSQNIRNAELSTSESEDDETEQHKTFRRREITSNWAKYDFPPAEEEDSEVTQRGKDVNKLLQATGSSIAHFRFKDEETWDDVEVSDGQDTQLLSLDCNKLADSLDCLPVYAQMRLDKDIFLPEQLLALEELAERNRTAAGLPPLHKTDNLPENSEQSLPTHGNPPTTELASPKSTTAADGKLKTAPGTVSSGKGVKSVSDSGASTVEQKGTLAGAGAGFSDTDLNSLLDVADGAEDKSATEFVTINTSNSSGRAVSERSGVLSKEKLPGSSEKGALSLEVTDQDLDDLLAMDTPSQLASFSSSKKAKESNIAAAELEDWLDSVLDS